VHGLRVTSAILHRKSLVPKNFKLRILVDEEEDRGKDLSDVGDSFSVAGGLLGDGGKIPRRQEQGKIRWVRNVSPTL
jgi:hypothetical protein